MNKGPKEVDFNSIARIYDSLVKIVFHSSIQRAQISFIQKIPINSHVLIIGGGTGFILQEIIRTTHPLKITYIDSSSKMIELAEKKIQNLNEDLKNQIEFRCGTEKSILPNEKFDCICTHFFLDIFPKEQVMAMIEKLSSHTKANSIWLFADFRKTDSLFHKLLLKLMLLFFRFTTNIKTVQIEEFDPLLNTYGWIAKETTFLYNGMIQSSIFEKH